jgi:hypothetical protein
MSSSEDEAERAFDVKICLLVGSSISFIGTVYIFITYLRNKDVQRDYWFLFLSPFSQSLFFLCFLFFLTHTPFLSQVVVLPLDDGFVRFGVLDWHLHSYVADRNY